MTIIMSIRFRTGRFLSKGEKHDISPKKKNYEFL